MVFSYVEVSQPFKINLEALACMLKGGVDKGKMKNSTKSTIYDWLLLLLLFLRFQGCKSAKQCLWIFPVLNVAVKSDFLLDARLLIGVQYVC